MPVRCPLGKPMQPQGTLQRDGKGMPGRHGGAEVDERITVAVRAGMSTRGELIDASLAGGQKPACRAQPGGDHLGGVRSPTSSARAASSWRLTSTGWRSSSSATSGASCLERDRDGTVIACSKVTVFDTRLNDYDSTVKRQPWYLRSVTCGNSMTAMRGCEPELE